jgi:hypothetical protein
MHGANGMHWRGKGDMPSIGPLRTWLWETAGL